MRRSSEIWLFYAIVVEAVGDISYVSRCIYR